MYFGGEDLIGNFLIMNDDTVESCVFDETEGWCEFNRSTGDY